MPIVLRPGFAKTGLKATPHEKNLNGPVLTGAEINVDLAVDANLATQRENAIKAGTAATVMSMSLGYNNELLAIKKGHPLVISKAQRKLSGKEHLFPTRSSAFSSFAGFPVGSMYSTQEQFEDDHAFVGISHGDVNFGIGTSNEKQVSAQVAGACSIEWNSNDPITIGQPALWQLHSVDLDTRNAEVEALPPLQRRSKAEMGVSFRAMRPDEVSAFVTRAVDLGFSSKATADMSDFTILLDSDRLANLDSTTRLALSLRGHIMNCVAQGLIHAVERGWVLPNFPSGDFGYDRFSQNEALTPVDMMNLHRELPHNLQADRADFARFIAGKCGLLPNHRPSKWFVNTVAARVLRGAASVRDTFDSGDISYLFADVEQEPMAFEGNNPVNTIFNTDSVGSVLALHNHRSATHVYRTAVEIVQRIDSRIAFYAMSNPLPGGKVHAVLKL